LNDFKSDNLIELSRKRIRLLDLAALADVAEGDI
jgi:hypothetical protein